MCDGGSGFYYPTPYYFGYSQDVYFVYRVNDCSGNWGGTAELMLGLLDENNQTVAIANYYDNNNDCKYDIQTNFVNMVIDLSYQQPPYNTCIGIPCTGYTGINYFYTGLAFDVIQNGVQKRVHMFYSGTPPQPFYNTTTTVLAPNTDDPNNPLNPENPNNTTYNIYSPPPADFIIDKIEQQCEEAAQAQVQQQVDNIYNNTVNQATAVVINSIITNILDPTVNAETFKLTFPVKEYQYTLYYYDQAGNLVQTVPPEGFDAAGANTGSPAHFLTTQYQYNSHNLLVWQKTPDADVSTFTYDKMDQLRYSQNKKQNTLSKFSYTKYDMLGRVFETGVTSSAPSDATINTYGQESTPISDVLVNLYPEHSTCTEVVRTYYDKYFGAVMGPNDPIYQDNNRSRVSVSINYGTYSYVDPSAYQFASYYAYDAHGNVKSVTQDFKESLGLKRTDYSYDLISNKVNQVTYQPGQGDQFIHKYGYDADNRITNVWTSRDGVVWFQDAKYFYYKHGPLARTELGQYKVQGIDYAYTLQGWLKGVNSATLDETRDMGRDGNVSTGNINQFVGRDAFAYSLGYYVSSGSVNDYTACKGTSFNSFLIDKSSMSTSLYTDETFGSETVSTSLFNGNISSMVTSFQKPVSAGGGKEAIAYKYNYDQLNRIRRMKSWNVNLSANTIGTAASAASEYTFDRNGNILTQKNTSFTNVIFDDQVYSYDKTSGKLNSNKLTGITEAGASYAAIDDLPSNSTYQYDAIGNLIQDSQAGITNIDWFANGKVKKVYLSGSNSLEFTYDAFGNRVKKISTVSGIIKTTYYAYDAAGKVMATYFKDGSSEIQLRDMSIFSSNRIGLLNVMQNLSSLSITSPYKLTQGKRWYEMVNLTGNIISVISDHRYGSGSSSASYFSTADIISANDYYPFGMYSRTNNSVQYLYGFQGQEKEDEINGIGGLYAYEYRMHDSRTGRFWSLDPLEKKYPYNSPYAFSENRVIDCFELEGKETSTGNPDNVEKRQPAQSSTYVAPPKVDPKVQSSDKKDDFVSKISTVTGALGIATDPTSELAKSAVKEGYWVGKTKSGWQLYGPDFHGNQNIVKSNLKIMQLSKSIKIGTTLVTAIGLSADLVDYVMSKEGAEREAAVNKLMKNVVITSISIANVYVGVAISVVDIMKDDPQVKEDVKRNFYKKSQDFESRGNYSAWKTYNELNEHDPGQLEFKQGKK